MDVDWIATDPESGRLSGMERRSSAEEYVARIEALRALGWGYSEVHMSGADFPGLALSFRGSYAVVHQFAAEDKVLLLAGDGMIGDDEVVLVPMLDDTDDTTFTGAVVLSTARAFAAVREFVRHGSVEDLGDWEEL